MKNLTKEDVIGAFEGARVFFTCVVPLVVVTALLILAVVWSLWGE